jgi:hypothetical protein
MLSNNKRVMTNVNIYISNVYPNHETAVENWSSTEICENQWCRVANKEYEMIMSSTLFCSSAASRRRIGKNCGQLSPSLLFTTHNDVIMMAKRHWPNKNSNLRIHWRLESALLFVVLPCSEDFPCFGASLKCLAFDDFKGNGGRGNRIPRQTGS